ncbi:MAG: 30S ribosomal protein S3 [Candidatus Moeniiplasma glomeromycotorum]|nr:30S ribosomal protein S3 [Candidatus Moeniiplasma glomeromycotorum]MCE8168094.1 30S ribosomal protein S3 [Candidatus Moeniiplasma glomeromycotorum]MCE8169638.1 30S ribosomal protein S3 [Candidatus Moeniiplasma glomeromycotorum]
MAQKASPYAIRLGYNQDWNTYFFAENKEEEINLLKRDKAIRDYLHLLFPDTDRLKIEYTKNNVFVNLYIPEISLVLGENNAKLAKIMKDIYQMINDEKVAVKINLIEVKKIYSHAQSIANLIVGQLKKRARSRQIMGDITRKISVEREIKGFAVHINGLIDGQEIAQKKKFIHGRMPLSTKDSKIEMGESRAIMARGVIGVKVLLYKGKFWPKRNKNHGNTEKN